MFKKDGGTNYPVYFVFFNEAIVKIWTVNDYDKLR